MSIGCIIYKENTHRACEFNSIKSAINESIVRVTSNQSGTTGKARGTRKSAGTSDIIRRGRPRP